ncbi:MAG TPA: hypothetical protein VF824_20260 [Thermoanaerobaculia bacterium]
MALWLGGGVLAFLLARIIPYGREQTRWSEGFAALAAALLLGFAATALDFGGVREPDWRAGLFALLGAFAAAGAVRLARSARRA